MNHYKPFSPFSRYGNHIAASLLLLALLLVTFLAAPLPAYARPMQQQATIPCVVGIDPGHGGRDPGAVRVGVRESDIVWNVSLLVRERLETRGYTVVFSRGQDETLPNTTEGWRGRWQPIRNAGANLLVQIHANANDEIKNPPPGSGTEAWYQRNHSDSKPLAEALAAGVANRTGLRNRREEIGQAMFDNTIPSALIELAFINNPVERELMVGRPELFADGIVDGIVAFTATRCAAAAAPPLPIVAPVSSGTRTILVIDTSGSMDGNKLPGARQAANNVIDIISAENEALAHVSNLIGLISYAYDARVQTPLGSDLAATRFALDQLYHDGGTAMASGLLLARDMLDEHRGSQRPVIILMSDGLPNISLSGGDDDGVVRQELLDLADSLQPRGYCLYTVGFGQGSQIDPGLMAELSRRSGCGEYYGATNITELGNVYVTLRHVSTGDVRFSQQGRIAQGETVDMGTFSVSPQSELLLMTLNWPGSRLDPRLFDPRSRPVDSNYPGATISARESVTTIVIENPLAGLWQIGAYGAEVPSGMTDYNAVVSTRERAFALPPGRSGADWWWPVGGIMAGLAVFALLVRSRNTSLHSRWLLEVRDASGRNWQVPVGTSQLRIGRDPSCDVVLNDPDVSRIHCTIAPTNRPDRLNLHDVNSRAGTRRNGKPITRGSLQNGDKVQIGRSTLRASYRIRG